MMRAASWRIGLLLSFTLLINCFLFPRTSHAFSVLAHQAIVDHAWKKQLRPMIQGAFLTPAIDELTDARAYARAGSHLPDLGYFPLGNRVFTDLLHYVRTGDFVDSSDNRSAYASGVRIRLGRHGALRGRHRRPSAGDQSRGADICIRSWRREYGDTVTYAESPSAHLQTEFRFDILQVAHRREIPELFEHSIGV